MAAVQATQFGIAGQGGLAWAAGLGAAGFAAFVFQGFRRVRPGPSHSLWQDSACADSQIVTQRAYVCPGR